MSIKEQTRMLRSIPIFKRSFTGCAETIDRISDENKRLKIENGKLKTENNLVRRQHEETLKRNTVLSNTVASFMADILIGKEVSA